MARVSLFRVALLLVILVLLISVPSTEAKKKKKKTQQNDAVETPAAASASGNDYSANQYSADAAKPDKVQKKAAKKHERVYTEEELAHREKLKKQRIRKAGLLATRNAKRAKALEKRLKEARTRNEQLARKRAERQSRERKQKQLELKRIDALAEKKRAADAPDLRKKTKDKLNALLNAAAKSSTRIISIDTREFHQYVSDGPRSYFLMLTFTALAPSAKCHYCHMAHEGLIPVAQAHYERSKKLAQAVIASNSTSSFAESELPIFFVNVDHARNDKLFSEMSFNSAPTMVLAPPRLGASSIKATDFLKKLPQKYKFNLQASMASQDFSQFIDKLVGVKVDLNATPVSTLDLLVVLFVLLSLAVAGWKWGFSIILFLRDVPHIRSPIMVFGWFFYAWCIAGGMYNIIRHTQFSEVRKDGSINYINGDGRDQFASEGMILGALNLGCALFVVLLNTRAFSSPEVVDPKATKRISPLTHFKNAISPFFSPSICLGVGTFCWWCIISIYTRKNWHYRMGFVWRD